MPKVSVILPIYNVERYLEQCLNTLKNQTLSDIEIICVDDGSTDSSPSIMDSFAMDDARFTVIHKENGGYGKAVNTGLQHAKAPYIGIVEPDDYVDETMYSRLIGKATELDNPDIVKAAYWRVINADTPEQVILPANYLHVPKYVNRTFTLAEDAEFLYHHPSIWTAIYRRDFLSSHGIKMHEIPGAGWADNPWLIETLSTAETIAYLDECLYYYREFNTGSSSQVKDPAIIFSRWLDMDRFIKEKGITAPLILEGHYNRGCCYIQMLQDDFPKNATAQAGIKSIADRIDDKVVINSHKIPLDYKMAFYREKRPDYYYGIKLKHAVKNMIRH